MREAYHTSVVNKITPIQAMAWNLEHTALERRNAGDPLAADEGLRQARQLRMYDLRLKLDQLLQYSDAQNDIIDIGMGLKEGKVPIVVPVFEQPTALIPYQGDSGDER